MLIPGSAPNNLALRLNTCVLSPYQLNIQNRGRRGGGGGFTPRELVEAQEADESLAQLWELAKKGEQNWSVSTAMTQPETSPVDSAPLLEDDAESNLEPTPPPSASET